MAYSAAPHLINPPSDQEIAASRLLHNAEAEFDVNKDLDRVAELCRQALGVLPKPHAARTTLAALVYLLEKKLDPDPLTVSSLLRTSLILLPDQVVS